MPSTYDGPVVEMNVMALAWVAIIEKAIAYHGIELLASTYFLTVFDPCPRHVP
jgi:hypothetical protein